MARQRMANDIARAHGRIEWIDGGTRHAKGMAHALQFKNARQPASSKRLPMLTQWACGHSLSSRELP